MGKAVIVYDEKKKKVCQNVLEMMRDIFAREGVETEILELNGKRSDNEYSAWLKDHEEEFSYVCSLDMAGFRFGTLLGGTMYNLLRPMQIHIVLNPEVMADYQGIECALNLFFFVPTQEELPFSVLNRTVYPSLETEGRMYRDTLENRKILDSIISAVLQENLQS